MMHLATAVARCIIYFAICNGFGRSENGGFLKGKAFQGL
ncbi:hypothetical protein J2Z34_001449 [Youngiibacter multivorans]|uniref:Uncharacterized protein n=1 Tax=Youngiibacter multivorans TaxID=937251 RepID=A0ABS4G348_9CLOT|nr:hypothetical protein [Youngiibacter multivorans]